MRIGINAVPLRLDGGGARYVFTGILDALLRNDDLHTYIIFAHPEGVPLIREVVKHCVEVKGPAIESRVRIIETVDFGQIFAYRGEYDLYFAPLNNLQPRLYDRPTVAILHDIQEQYFPQYFKQTELLGRYEDYPEICRAATTVIAISEQCRDSFVDKFQIDPAKIEVVYNAPQAKLVDRAEGDRGAWSQAPLPEAYFFYPANTYLHKNHELILDAMEELRRTTGDCPHFVFSGFETATGFPLRAEISRRGLENRTRFFNGLSVEEMRYLFCHAIATVMPTMFEGFGMPAVEAQACGCPLICSDLPVMHEIARDHALYFPPGDMQGLITQLRVIQENATLRQELIDRGHEVVQQFNWNVSARRMLDVFERAQYRFSFGPRNPQTTERPRIGIVIRLIHGGANAVQTINSLLDCGYPKLVMRVVGDERVVPADVLKYIAQAGAKFQHAEGKQAAGMNALLDFAREERLDIVGEALEGNRYKTSAMDSAAWSMLEAPEKSVFLGEAMEWRGTHFLRVARMRVTGDQLWKLEGFLYPELVLLNVAAITKWQEKQEASQSDLIEWRWDLIRLAQRDNQLFIMRRTLADCDSNLIGLWTKYHAIKAGMYRYYSVKEEVVPKVNIFRRVEPAVKRASMVLPQKWQDRGTRIWYLLSR